MKNNLINSLKADVFATAGVIFLVVAVRVIYFLGLLLYEFIHEPECDIYSEYLEHTGIIILGVFCWCIILFSLRHILVYFLRKPFEIFIAKISTRIGKISYPGEMIIAVLIISLTIAGILLTLMEIYQFYNTDICVR